MATHIISVRPDDKLGAVLDWGTGPRRCAIGSGGIGVKEREGDGITPIGQFALREVRYRPDRLARPHTTFPVSPLTLDDGWCDAVGDAHYNRWVKLPYPVSVEHMWRDDRLYDVVAILGFNDDPVVDGKGSAIFLHLARGDYGPTQGCVALACSDILALLAAIPADSAIRITG